MVRVGTRFSLMVTAFVSGFVLLAYELVVARLLAPSLGSSTYVWTSVIGTVIAALALGYWAGGRLADRRGRSLDIAWLCLLAAAAVLWTLLLSPVLLGMVARGGDPRIQGVVAALVLCVPASFLLGTLGPYLAKLRVTSLAGVGRSVASLDALNSIGGITGTFITGFFLFSLIGSRESLLVLIGLILAAGFLHVPRERVVVRIVGSVAVLASATAATFGYAGATTAIDTPSAHYSIYDAPYGDAAARLVSTGPRGAQSGIDLNDPDRLLFWYTRALADVVAKTPERSRILVLGGGTFTLPSYLARTYPDSTVDTVEIDGSLPAIARDYFGYRERPNLHVFAGDARAFVNTTDERYDIVIVDVYNDVSVPFSLFTAEYARGLARITTDSAVVAVNAITSFAPACTPVFSALDAAYRSQFANALYLRQYPDAPEPSNVILAYSRKPRAMSRYAVLPSFDATAFTDNFAPVEGLQARCVGA